jgi:hypothetical protein
VTVLQDGADIKPVNDCIQALHEARLLQKLYHLTLQLPECTQLPAAMAKLPNLWWININAPKLHQVPHLEFESSYIARQVADHVFCPIMQGMMQQASNRKELGHCIESNLRTLNLQGEEVWPSQQWRWPDTMLMLPVADDDAASIDYIAKELAQQVEGMIGKVSVTWIATVRSLSASVLRGHVRKRSKKTRQNRLTAPIALRSGGYELITTLDACS